MPWLFSILLVVAGMQFEYELARHLPIAPTELRLLLTGVLAGLGISYVMGEINARALGRRRHYGPHV